MAPPAATVEKKEVLILGPSGSGKSVLMNRMKEIYSNYGVYASFPPYVATVGVDVATVAKPNVVSNNRNGKAQSFLDIREVGGSLSARWKSYIPFCSYVIYTIDISDPSQFSTAYVLLNEMLVTWAEIEANNKLSSRATGSTETNEFDSSLSCFQWGCGSLQPDTQVATSPAPDASSIPVATSAPTGSISPAGRSTVWNSMTAAEKAAAAEAEEEALRNKVCHRERPKLIIAFTKTDNSDKNKAASGTTAAVEASSTRGATGVGAAGPSTAEPYELVLPDAGDPDSYLCGVDELVASAGLNECLQRYTGLFDTIEVMYGTSFVAAANSIVSSKAGAAPSSANDCIKATLPYQICSWLRYN